MKFKATLAVIGGLVSAFGPTSIFGQTETQAEPNPKRHWAFQPVHRPALPGIQQRGWSRNGIDRFILNRLEAEGIAPSPEADRVTLIRRASLDLIGLPPTPDEVKAFINDSQPDAYERLVDRLLASPQYGERWARPWLDLCHYADTDGYLTDQLRPVAWRYRNWLIDALNRDLPFDRFTIEQLAGDLLTQSTMDQRIATGFLRQTLSNREGGADIEEFRVKQIIDRTRMVGTVWLGLTIGCARCHDHKYDPLLQREFFQFYAFFDNADEVNIDAPLPHEREAYWQARPEYNRRRQALIKPIQQKLEELERRWELRLLRAYKNPSEDAHWDRQWELLGLVWGGGKGEGQLEGTEIVKLDPAKRTQRQKDDILDKFLQSPGGFDPKRYSQLKLSELRTKLEKLKTQFPQATRAPTMRASQTPRETYIHARGDFRDRGETVRPGIPACLPRLPSFNRDPAGSALGERSSDALAVGLRLNEAKSEVREARRPRLALARWLVSRQNPLTSRVTVNRIWQEFFGRGLVLTSEDFGTRGERPSHPELLDWLAVEFMDGGWRVKAIHRLIVTSATYRQSSRPRPELLTRDPDNVLLARQNSLRVPAETVRDMSLAVSGLLSRQIGGPSVHPPQPDRVSKEAFGNYDWKVSQGSDRYRRGVYTFTLRTAPFAQSSIFDAPNPNETCARRERSNTPLQALTLLNDQVFFEAAQALAARLMRSESRSDRERILLAFQLCLSRRATDDETARLTAYLHRYRNALRDDPAAAKTLLLADHWDGVDPIEAAAWSGVSSVLLNLHEFITRD